MPAPFASWPTLHPVWVTCLLEAPPDGPHGRNQAVKLLEVERGEPLKTTRSEVRQADADYALIIWVGGALDKARGGRPIDQLEGAVGAEEQVPRDITNGGALGVVVAADGEQKLVLSGGEADSRRLAPAPSQEPAEAGAELEKAPVLGVGQCRVQPKSGWCRRHIHLLARRAPLIENLPSARKTYRSTIFQGGEDVEENLTDRAPLQPRARARGRRAVQARACPLQPWPRADRASPREAA